MVDLPRSKAARLGGHKGPIYALTFSSGSQQYLLSGSQDHSIKLYNPTKAFNDSAQPGSNTSALIQSYEGGHGYEVLSVNVSSDNSRFVSGGGDKLVFLWDVTTAKTLRRFGSGPGGHNGRVECVCFGGDEDSVLLSGSYDTSVKLWDTKAQGNRPMMTLSEAKDSVSDIKVVGSEVFTGSMDGRVRVYDLRMGMMYVDVIGQPVSSLSVNTQGDSILVSTLDSTLRLMSKSDGTLLQTYRHADFVNTNYRLRSMLAAKDNLAVTGSEDGSVYAWDILTGELVTTVKHYETKATLYKASSRTVLALAYRKKGDYWASAGGDGTIVIWAWADRPDNKTPDH